MRVRHAIGLGVGLALAAGCHGAPAPQANGPVTVKVTYWGGPEEMAIIQGLQERLRSSLSLSTRRQVTGWVLEAGYAVPPPDPSLDDLLDRIA